MHTASSEWGSLQLKILCFSFLFIGFTESLVNIKCGLTSSINYVVILKNESMTNTMCLDQPNCVGSRATSGMECRCYTDDNPLSLTSLNGVQCVTCPGNPSEQCGDPRDPFLISLIEYCPNAEWTEWSPCSVECALNSTTRPLGIQFRTDNSQCNSVQTRDCWDDRLCTNDSIPWCSQVFIHNHKLLGNFHTHSECRKVCPVLHTAVSTENGNCYCIENTVNTVAPMRIVCDKKCPKSEEYCSGKDSSVRVSSGLLECNGPWITYSECNIPCDSGLQTFVRNCPSNISLREFLREPCNTQSCQTFSGICTEFPGIFGNPIILPFPVNSFQECASQCPTWSLASLSSSKNSTISHSCTCITKTIDPNISINNSYVFPCSLPCSGIPSEGCGSYRTPSDYDEFGSRIGDGHLDCGTTASWSSWSPCTCITTDTRNFCKRNHVFKCGILFFNESEACIPPLVTEIICTDIECDFATKCIENYLGICKVEIRRKNATVVCPSGTQCIIDAIDSDMLTVQCNQNSHCTVIVRSTPSGISNPKIQLNCNSANCQLSPRIPSYENINFDCSGSNCTFKCDYGIPWICHRISGTCSKNSTCVFLCDTNSCNGAKISCENSSRCDWNCQYGSCAGMIRKCDDSSTCVGGCEVDCAGKSCGTDGCGGNCPVLAIPCDVCTSTGQCTSCTPSCAQKSCGSDGCGGTCGSCEDDELCVSGICTNSSLCSPNDCICGIDNCGHICGICTEGTTCLNGKCQMCTTNPVMCTEKMNASKPFLNILNFSDLVEFQPSPASGSGIPCSSDKKVCQSFEYCGWVSVTNRLECLGCRHGFVSSNDKLSCVGAVIPNLLCWVHSPPDQYFAIFGYNNIGTNHYKIGYSSDNSVSIGSKLQFSGKPHQPQDFHADGAELSWVVEIESRDTIVWKVVGNNVSVNFTDTNEICPPDSKFTIELMVPDCTIQKPLYQKIFAQNLANLILQISAQQIIHRMVVDLICLQNPIFSDPNTVTPAYIQVTIQHQQVSDLSRIPDPSFVIVAELFQAIDEDPALLDRITDGTNSQLISSNIDVDTSQLVKQNPAQQPTDTSTSWYMLLIPGGLGILVFTCIMYRIWVHKKNPIQEERI